MTEIRSRLEQVVAELKRYRMDARIYELDSRPIASPQADRDGQWIRWDDLTEILASPPEEPATGWRDIASAPKGSWPDGPERVDDPAYVKPPHLWLTLEDGQRCVGYFDAYYAEGGSAYDGEPPWVEEFSGERVRPTHWQPLPEAPPPPSPIRETP